jgi:hypothetical protein
MDIQALQTLVHQVLTMVQSNLSGERTTKKNITFLQQMKKHL